MKHGQTPSLFGQRLRFHRLQSYDRSGKSLSQIKLAGLLEERGLVYNRNHVGAWENGTQRIDATNRKLLVGLIGVFRSHGGLQTLQEANELLALGDYRSLNSGESDSIDPGWQLTPIDRENNMDPEAEQVKFEINQAPSQSGFIATLPERRYQNFVGRRAELDYCLSKLRNPNAHPLLGISGMGGVGKSALARELVERIRGEPRFLSSWWTTAKQQAFEPLEEISSEAQISYETILDQLQRWLGLGGKFLTGPGLTRRETMIRAMLEKTPALLVLDSLEAAANQEEIAERFSRLLQGTACRGILTSRDDWILAASAMDRVPLKGLEEGDALVLMQETARETNNVRALAASKESLQGIAQAVGRMPLALKLSLGLLEGLEVRDLIAGLEDIQLAELQRLYEYLFASNWRSLDDAERNVLIAIATFDEEEGVSAEHLRAADVVPDHTLLQAIGRLRQLSLVEAVGSVENTRYLLHPLTLNFLRSQMR